MSTKSISQTVVRRQPSGSYRSTTGQVFTYHEVLAARKSLIVYNAEGERLSAKELNRRWRNLQNRRKSTSARQTKAPNDAWLTRSTAERSATKQSTRTVTLTFVEDIVTRDVLWWFEGKVKHEPAQPVNRFDILDYYPPVEYKGGNPIWADDICEHTYQYVQ